MVNLDRLKYLAGTSGANWGLEGGHLIEEAIAELEELRRRPAALSPEERLVRYRCASAGAVAAVWGDKPCPKAFELAKSIENLAHAMLAGEKPAAQVSGGDVDADAIDHYREGLYRILRGEKDAREIAASYLGEDVPEIKAS